MLNKTILGSCIWLLSTSFVAAAQTTPTTQAPSLTQKSQAVVEKITPEGESALEQRIHSMQLAADNPWSIALYRPTYILPFYYTATPDTAVYQSNTPNNQQVMHEELKAQISLTMPIIPKLVNDKTSLNIAYTQLSYWQVYASSQYFRETNYEPEIFVSSHFYRNWLVSGGFDHQSNGRGGDLERSWNRAIASSYVSGPDWLFGVKVWGLIFQNQSSNLHNPDIAHYLGYDSLLFSYKFHNVVASIQTQNVESGFARGSTTLSLSYPVAKNLSLYTEYFHGYGQSLIEYNHKTNSIGVGFVLNDWI